ERAAKAAHIGATVEAIEQIAGGAMLVHIVRVRGEEEERFVQARDVARRRQPRTRQGAKRGTIAAWFAPRPALDASKRLRRPHSCSPPRRSGQYATCG